MSDRLKLAGFGVALVAVFAVALGIGKLAAPDSEPAAPAAAPGLADSADGYTLTAIEAPGEPKAPGALRFRITDRDGAAVTRFATRHDEKLHLIVVRSDGAGYRHVHPAMSPDGVWSIDWSWAEPGSYRVFADFAPEGADELVLSRTVEVAGAVAPQPVPPPAAVARVDGYEVTLTGDLSTAGSELRFTVRRNGAPVTDLEPYLGAYAHLVALRAADLAYLHVHPEGEVGRTPPGPEVAFHAEAPSTGDYLLYLDFKHGGRVHTAEFTASVAEQPSDDGHGNEHGSGSGEHGHGHGHG
ncbi:hypothetical protein [Nocardia sp. NPDC057353]|uniref:hypothetical protein n=1 Tax=Nocardia sp. NPDC057353 TaxID=3346104 RepID=UPI0036385A0F